MNIVSWESGRRHFQNRFLSLNWKLDVFLRSTFFSSLFARQYWCGKQLMQPKKYLKITYFLGIYLRLVSRALQNSCDFLSWLLNSTQKWQKKKGQQIFRTIFRMFFLAKKFNFFSFFLLLYVLFSIILCKNTSTQLNSMHKKRKHIDLSARNLF